MNFASNKKKRLLYQKNSAESLSNKKRKINKVKIKTEKTLDRFNFFIDILSTNKKVQEKSQKIVSNDNKENNSENINHPTPSLILNNNNNSNNNNNNNENNTLISVEDVNNAIIEDIEYNIENYVNNKEIKTKGNKGKVKEKEKEILKENESLDVGSDETISTEKPKKISKKTILQLKENKIIERNINLILNKDKSLTRQKKINKKDINIINQFQLNALGYINYYVKKRKELLKSKKPSDDVENLNEDIERLIDQEWIILETKIKNKCIEESVKKQTKKIKKNIKSKKVNQNNNILNENIDNEEIENIINNEIENDNDNQITDNQKSNSIPNIPDSEMIKQELKEYTEINLLTEMYNDAKKIPIPHFSVIKHPPNPFSIFTKDNINVIIKKNPSLTRAQALKIVAKKWKNVDSEEKAKYVEKSKEYKDDYEDLIKYAYLQRALINNPNIARLCLENQLKGNEEINQEQENNIEEKNINFKELENDDDIIKAFKYIVRKFPQGYPLASPILRFPERGITQKFKKSQKKAIENLNDKENENMQITKKGEKINVNIKPKLQAFDFFVKDHYKILMKSSPTITLSDLFDELEKEWKYLSYDDKLPYILLEIKDVKRYYMEQCEISKERRGRKHNPVTEIIDEENEEILNKDDNENIMVINSNSENNQNKKHRKTRKIRHKKSKNQEQSQYQSQQQRNRQQQDVHHESSTLIEDSEGEQDDDTNLLYIEKNRILGRNENNFEMKKFNNNSNQSSYSEIDENYIDSDTSEEYLSFDNVSRKFIFEKSNDDEIENSAKENVYDHFDIQAQINKNKNNDNNNRDNTFIPVVENEINNSLSYSLSQNTVVYNTPEDQNNENPNDLADKQSINYITQESNESIIENPTSNSQPELQKKQNSFMTLSQDSKSDIFLSPNTLIINSITHPPSQSIADKEKINLSPITNKSKGKSDENRSISFVNENTNSEKSNSNIFTESDHTTLETPPSYIESSLKKSLDSNFKYSIMDKSNLETPKNSQESKKLLKPLRPIRKSATWKFGNDIGLIQHVSEEQIGYISGKNKNNDDGNNDIDHDEISSNSSSSSSSDDDDDDDEEEEENNIFVSKERNLYPHNLNHRSEREEISNSQSINNSRRSSSNIPKLSSPIKYKINKRRMDDEKNDEENDEEIEEVKEYEEENKNNNKNKHWNQEKDNDEIEEIYSSNNQNINRNIDLEEDPIPNKTSISIGNKKTP
eukprot:jgi/Orpsp1_1/1174448/evm.model.c7180000050132.1